MIYGIGDNTNVIAFLDKCDKTINTTSTIYNQTVSRTCPGSWSYLKDKKYVMLRYAPREPIMINLNTE